MSSSYYTDTVKDALFPRKTGVVAKNNRYIKTVEPEAMTAAEIRKLREKKLRLSTAVLADALNVSKKTVEAWESGTNIPSGSSLRLLRMIEKNPDILFEAGVLEDRTALR